jgi:hypothetical protein
VLSPSSEVKMDSRGAETLERGRDWLEGVETLERRGVGGAGERPRLLGPTDR